MLLIQNSQFHLSLIKNQNLSSFSKLYNACNFRKSLNALCILSSAVMGLSYEIIKVELCISYKGAPFSKI